VALLLTAPTPVIPGMGVTAFAGVLQEDVLEDSAAQEVWVVEGGSPVQTVLLLVLLMQCSTDEAAAADEQGCSEHSVVVAA